MRKCEHCGRPLPPQKGRGRPRSYHPKCKRFVSLLGWVAELADGIEYVNLPRMHRVRAELVAVTNTFRIAGDGDRDDLARQLARYRKASGRLQREVAAELGCSRRRIGRLESGQARWSRFERAAFAKLLSGEVDTTQAAVS